MAHDIALKLKRLSVIDLCGFSGETVWYFIPHEHPLCVRRCFSVGVPPHNEGLPAASGRGCGLDQRLQIKQVPLLAGALPQPRQHPAGSTPGLPTCELFHHVEALAKPLFSHIQFSAYLGGLAAQQLDAIMRATYAVWDEHLQESSWLVYFDYPPCAADMHFGTGHPRRAYVLPRSARARTLLYALLEHHNPRMNQRFLCSSCPAIRRVLSMDDITIR